MCLSSIACGVRAQEPRCSKQLMDIETLHGGIDRIYRFRFRMQCGSKDACICRNTGRARLRRSGIQWFTARANTQGQIGQARLPLADITLVAQPNFVCVTSDTKNQLPYSAMVKCIRKADGAVAQEPCIPVSQSDATNITRVTACHPANWASCGGRNRSTRHLYRARRASPLTHICWQ
ncbi:hypothetical protein D3C72_1411880 [compost metagenome]